MNAYGQQRMWDRSIWWNRLVAGLHLISEEAYHGCLVLLGGGMVLWLHDPVIQAFEKLFIPWSFALYILQTSHHSKYLVVICITSQPCQTLEVGSYCLCHYSNIAAVAWYAMVAWYLVFLTRMSVEVVSLVEIVTLVLAYHFYWPCYIVTCTASCYLYA